MPERQKQSLWIVFRTRLAESLLDYFRNLICTLSCKLVHFFSSIIKIYIKVLYIRFLQKMCQTSRPLWHFSLLSFSYMILIISLILELLLAIPLYKLQFIISIYIFNLISCIIWNLYIFVGHYIKFALIS